MVLHDTSPKPFFFQPFQQPRVLQHVIVSKPFVETPSTHRTFHRAVPSPFFLEIELTENQCQSVSRSVFPLGCWCEPLHWGAEAIRASIVSIFDNCFHFLHLYN